MKTMLITAFAAFTATAGTLDVKPVRESRSPADEIPPETMRAVYEEVKTPYKAGGSSLLLSSFGVIAY